MSLRILWFYRYIAAYDFDNWLHLKFVEILKQYPGVEVLVYGPDIQSGYPHLTTMPYNDKITIHDIKRHFNFDVIIMNTKSRMFMHYDPHNKVANGQWLPNGFDTIDVPRIVIEEDYHYETDDKWYKDNNIDIILQRHWSQSLRQTNVPMRWFPFSVDIGKFKPTVRPEHRHNKICFAGSTNADVYRYRNTACEILNRANLIAIFARKEKIGQSYIECLKQYISHLSCSSVFKLSPAKMFEIMASGSILLTNTNDDLPLLFPQGSYFTYNLDFSNLVSVAQDILNNRPMVIDAVRKGWNAITTRHSHQVRIIELLTIINNLLAMRKP